MDVSPLFKLKLSIEEYLIVVLKILSSHLTNVFLGNLSTLPIIISPSLIRFEEKKLLRVLKENIRFFGWSIADIKELVLQYACIQF